MAKAQEVGYTRGVPVEHFIAGGTLAMGDVVFLSAANTVSKSVTAADYLKKIGVVVGGAKTYGEILTNIEDVGETVAVATEQVTVALGGIVWVVAAAAIAAGIRVVADTVTAGRVKAWVAETPPELVGIALEAAAGAASKFKILAYNQ